MIRLSREELEAVFMRAWSNTHNPVDVAEAIQVAVLSKSQRAPLRAPRRTREEIRANEHCAALDEVLVAVSAARVVPIVEIKSASRKRPVADARHEAMWLMRTMVLPTPSLLTIGAAMGGADHTTVLAAVRKIQDRVDADPGYGDRLRAIVARVVAPETRRAA